MLISRGEENAQQRICGIWPSPHRATGTWPLPWRASPTQPPPGRTVGLMTQWAQGQNSAPINIEGSALKKKKEYYCPSLRSSRACLARNLDLLRTLTPSTFLSYFSLWGWIVYPSLYYLSMLHHCILEACSLSGFMGSQLENFASGWFLLQASSISDTEYTCVRLWSLYFRAVTGMYQEF